MKEYSLTFGQCPVNFIERKRVKEQIISNITLDYPISRSYIITGVRGSGKTVLLSNIADEIKEKKDWIVVDVNPEKEILSQLVASIHASPKFKNISAKVSFSISFHGFGVTIEGKEEVPDAKIALQKTLSALQKDNVKLLVTIDEVSNSKNIRSFVHDFQSLIREDYNIYLLMTGLNENVDALQNNKTLTFLLRTPKIYLQALEIDSIEQNYLDNFSIDKNEASALANLTKGYAFAFQVVGLLYKKYQDSSLICDELDVYLENYVYNKIWEAIPLKEKVFLKSFGPNGDARANEIIEKANINGKIYSVYRDRLIKRGVIISKAHGELEFTLPRFYSFIEKQI